MLYSLYGSSFFSGRETIFAWKTRSHYVKVIDFLPVCAATLNFIKTKSESFTKSLELFNQNANVISNCRLGETRPITN